MIILEMIVPFSLYFLQVLVEPLETGFLVNIYSAKNCPGLLVLILQVFDELGLDVMEARVSCADSFRLKAFGEEVRYIKLSICYSKKRRTYTTSVPMNPIRSYLHVF